MSRTRTVSLTLLVLIAVGSLVALSLQTRSEAVFRQGLAAIETRDQATLLETIRVLQDRGGYESHVHLLRGAYLLRQDNAAAALQSFHSVVPEGELRRPALELTGECLFQLQQLPLAAAQYQELLRTDPASTDAHRWLGQIFYNLGAFQAAATHLQKLVELEPENYLAYALMGHMAFDFEDYQVSVENYRKALALERPGAIPEAIHQEVIQNLAQSLIGQNNYPAALETLKSADQDPALVLALQADCQRGLGKTDEARRLLDLALQRDPLQRKAVLLQVSMALDDQQTESAIAPLQRVLAQDPHDTACRYQLAQAWARLQQDEKYKQEIALHKESQRLKTLLTELNLEANRDPQDDQLRDRLADVCDKLGKQDLAVMWRQAAAACRQALLREKGSSR